LPFTPDTLPCMGHSFRRNGVSSMPSLRSSLAEALPATIPADIMPLLSDVLLIFRFEDPKFRLYPTSSMCHPVNQSPDTIDLSRPEVVYICFLEVTQLLASGIIYAPHRLLPYSISLLPVSRTHSHSLILLCSLFK
jgi:hypothetical protein